MSWSALQKSLSKLKTSTGETMKEIEHVDGIIPDFAYAELHFNECLLIGVSSIGDFAFQKNTSLSRVQLGVAESVGKGCFRGCFHLYDVNGPNVKRVKRYAFYGCRILKPPTLHPEVEIDVGAFVFCDYIDSFVGAITYVRGAPGLSGSPWRLHE
jgi:hypothetical protein